MSFTHWLKKWKASLFGTPRQKRRSAPRIRRGVRPLTEALEDRIVLTAGALDPTFGTGGKVLTDFLSGNDYLNSMAIQDDGKIVVAGSSLQNDTNYDFAAARYNTDGSLDTSFGIGGKVHFDFGNAGEEQASGVAVQPDGKIVMIGYIVQPGVTFYDFAVARLNSNGSLDTSFGTDGIVTIDFNEDVDYGTGVALQTDGKIVVTGWGYWGVMGSNFEVARLHSNGSLDTSFDTDGKQNIDFDSGSDTSLGVTIQADGKIVVPGYSDQGATGYDFTLARLNSNGSLDTSFSSDGKQTIDFGSSLDVAFSLAVQADDKLVVAGYSDQGATSKDFAVARLNSNGTLDPAFDTDGRQTIDFGGFDAVGGGQSGGNSLALQTDGKIVVAGYSADTSFTTSDFAVARLNGNGSLDASFDDDGKRFIDFDGDFDTATGVAVQTDGNLVVAGQSGQFDLNFAVVRLLQGSNTPPVVAANATTVSANEGGMLTNAGTFSDAQGNNTVSLTATVGGVPFGSVNKDDVHGTWSWSASAGDGPAGPVTVTITATDALSATATANFTYTINNVPPTASFAGNGTITYGRTATVSFTNPQDASSADAAAGLRYAYSLTGNFTGITYASGSSTSASKNYLGLNAGNYTIYGRIIDKNGGFTQYNTTLQVNKASLSVIASNGSKTYGQSDPASLNYTVQGLVNNDTKATALTGALSRAAGESVGNYTITKNTLAATGNYVLGTFTNGTFSITKASNNITFGNLSNATYGAASITLGASASSGLPINYTVVSGPGTINLGNLTITGAGTIVVRASQAGNASYLAATPVDRSLIVNRAPLTVTAVNTTKVYGQSDPAPLNYTYTGRVNGDLKANFTGNLTRATGENGGNYTISRNTLLATGNYIIGTFNNGTLAITPASNTITFGSLSSVSYGTAPFNLGASATSGSPVSFSVLSGPGFFGSTSSPPANPSFETPTQSLPAGFNGFLPTGGSWTFTGRAGITQNNGTAFAPPPTPFGSQAALLQSVGTQRGSMNQTLSFASAGNYTLQFAAAGRTGGANPFNVKIDGVVKGANITPVVNVYGIYDVPFNIATAGNHTLEFEGLGVGTSDVTSFIDNLSLAYRTNAGNTLVITGGGSIVIQASQAASANYAAAAPVNQTLTVIAGSGGIVTAGVLQFTISTVGSNFATSGNNRTFTTSGNTVVQVGFTPTVGTAFKPLMTLQGFVTINTANNSFSATGNVNTAIAGVSTPLLSSLPSSNITTLVGAGLPLSAGILSFKPGSLGASFTPSSLGLNTTAGLQLMGSLTPLSNLSISVNGANRLNINSGNVSLTGINPTPKGSITVGGARLNAANLTASYTAASNTFKLYGNANTTVSGISNLTLQLGQSASPGLFISNGTLTSLNGTIAGSFKVGNVTLAATSLNVAYNGTFNVYGSARVSISNLDPFDVIMGDAASPGLVITNGALSKLRSTVSGDLTVKGLSLKTTGTYNGIDNGVVLEYKNSAFTMTGNTALSFGPLGAISAGFGYNGTPGIIVDSTGKMTMLDLTVNGGFDLVKLKFTTEDLRFKWDSLTSNFSLSGKASFDLKTHQKRNIGGSQFGNQTAGGINVSIPVSNKVAVTFGYDVDKAKPGLERPGLIIQNGSLQYLDLTLDTDIKVGKWKFSTTGLEFTWDAANDEFKIPQGQIKLEDTSLFKGSGLDNLTVSFGHDVKAANGTVVQHNPGLVISNSTLDILDLTIDSRFYVYYGLIQVDVNNLQFKYLAPGKGGNTSDEATFSIPQGSASATPRFLDKLEGLGIDNKVSVTFGRDTQAANGTTVHTPGLLIQGDSLKILDITFSRDFHFPGMSMDADLTVSYVNGVFKIDGEAETKLLGIFNNHADLHLTVDNSPYGLAERLYSGGFSDENLDMSKPGSFQAITPTATRKLNSALNFNGNDLSARSGGRVGNDYVGAAWFGQVNIGEVGSGEPLEAGNITFGTRSDDGSMLFIDENKNGKFEANEMVVDNRGAHGAQDRVGTRNLKAGSYNTAISFYELEEGEEISVRFAQGTVSQANFGTMTLLDPSSPAQLGLWSIPPDYSDAPSVAFELDMNLEILGLTLADARLDLNYDGPSKTLTLTGGAKLDLGGIVTLDVNLGGVGTPGLVIVDGSLQALNISAHSSMDFAIVKANLDVSGSYSAAKPATYTSTTATNADLKGPQGVALDSAGNLYIADTENSLILKVSTNGLISVVNAGDLNRPHGVAVDAEGNLFIADTDNHRIRKLSASGDLYTVAGTGDGDDTLHFPIGVAVDAVGNLYIADTLQHRIRMLPKNGTISLTNPSFETPTMNLPSGFSGFGPTGGNWTFSGRAGITRNNGTAFGPPLTTAGSQAALLQSVNGQQGSMAQTVSFPYPGEYTLKFSAAGRSSSGSGAAPFLVLIDGVVIGDTITPEANVYTPYGVKFIIASPGNHTVEFAGLGIGGADVTSFIDDVVIIQGITTIAGIVGRPEDGSFSGDGGLAINAHLSWPVGLAVDTAGNLFFADLYNHRIRKVSTTGVITTVAGDGAPSFGGDGGPATSAHLNHPTGVAVDAAGNLFIVDRNNQRIRKVSASTQTISTVAGTGAEGYSGDGGNATSAVFALPDFIAVDAAGNLLFSDTNNHRIRKVTASTQKISTFAGTGVPGRIPGDPAVPAMLDLYGSAGIDVDLDFIGFGSHSLGSIGFSIHYVFGDNSASYVHFGYRFLLVDVWLWAHFDGHVGHHLHWVKNPFDWRFGGLGPLAGASVYYDANSDFDFTGDLSAITASNGSFPMDVPEGAQGQFVLVGGTDQSTGLTNAAILTAPAGARVISPFSTLINNIQQKTVTRERSAITQVQQALAIPAAIDPLETNYINQALAGDPQAARVFATEVQLTALSYQVDHLLGAAGGGTPEEVSLAFFDVLAMRIARTGGAPLDLADLATVQALIGDTAQKVNVTLDPDVSAGAATIAAGVNRYIKDLPVEGSLAYLNQVVRAQVVAQNTITPMLTQVGAGTMDISDVVAAETGNALVAQITGASVGPLYLDGPTINIDDAIAEPVNFGTFNNLGGLAEPVSYPATMEFPVYLTTASPLTEPVSVSYTTADGIATEANGDYTPVTGTLTWEPGDTGPKYISVPISPDIAARKNTYFYVNLSNPVNVEINDTSSIGDIRPYAKVATTTTLTTSTDATTADQNVTFTATVLTPDGAATGSVTFYDGDSVLGADTLENGVATFTTTLHAGNHTITALYQGLRLIDIHYDQSAAALTATIAPASQTIAFAPLADQVYGAAPFYLDTAASSGLPVSYRIVSGPATLNNDRVTITGAGAVIVEATQAGDADHSPADPVQQSFVVTPANLTFTVSNQEMTYGMPLPALTGTFSGFISGEGIDDFTVGINYHTVAPGIDVGTYDITATIDDPDHQLANYSVQVIAGVLTVNKADLFVGAYDTRKYYGDTAALSGTIVAATAIDVWEADGITATFTSNGTAPTATVAGGPYAVTSTLNDPNNRLRNYLLYRTDALLTVDKADATVIFSPANLTFSYAADASNATLSAADADPLTYDVTIDSVGHYLRATYNLTLPAGNLAGLTTGAPSAANLWYNYGGKQDKWLASSSGWFIILPNGDFYKWSGHANTANMAAGFQKITVSPVYWQNPGRIRDEVMGEGPIDFSVSGNQLTFDNPTHFEGQFRVTATATDGALPVTQSFFVNFTNLAPTLDPVANQTMPPTQDTITVALVAADAESDAITLSATVQSQAQIVKASIGSKQPATLGMLFEEPSTTNNSFPSFNYGRLGDKWLSSRDASGNKIFFYILPTGDLFRWDGTPNVAQGTFIANVGTNIYATPSLLINPLTPPATTSFAGSDLTVDPAASFRGTLVVTARATDTRGNVTTRTFNVTVAPAPTLTQPANINITGATATPITLNATDPSGLPLTYSVVSEALLLKTTYNLSFTGNLYEGFLGLGEKWLSGAGPINQAPVWYYITPTGQLFRWQEVSGNPIGQSAFVRTIDTRYWTDPSLLYNAHDQAEFPTLPFTGNTFTVTPSVGFTGTLVFTVYANNGVFQDNKTFTVTVS